MSYGGAPGEAPGGAPPACYLHPDRAALLRCSRCERPICGSDAIEAPVGYQCPPCAQGGQAVRRLRDLGTDPTVTKILLGVIAAAFVLTQVDQARVFTNFGLVPAFVGLGRWWTLVTSAFLHAGIIHVAFNGILLWRLGEMLERPLGHARFAALYAAGLAGGALGVILLAWARIATPLGEVPVLERLLSASPLSVTVGASGAVFGLMGAAVVGMRGGGINPWRTDIGTLVLLNLVITFMVPNISVGGHVGGLLAGMLAGRLLLVPRARARRAALVVTGLALAMLAASVWLATIITASLR